MTDDTIQCTKCGNRLDFGGASANLRGLGKKDLLEGMAEMLGWQKSRRGWECKAHG